MDADSYFMVLSNVLRGQDWKGSIDQFCETHMELFDFDGEEDDEFGHGHFAIWEEYRILAEEILESLLGELGAPSGRWRSRSTVVCSRRRAGPATRWRRTCWRTS